MCFSAGISFTSAAVLAVTGIATIRAVKGRPSLFWLAAIPLLFAIQQASEGMLWLQLTSASGDFTKIWTYVYMTFAYLIWPVWIPLALWTAEKVQWRKNLIGLCLLMGLLWTAYQSYSLAFINPQAHIVQHSIQYSGQYYSAEALRLFTLAYMCIIAIPFFATSVRNIWAFGLLTLLSAGIAHYFYQETFTSVWCFFAALVSLILYFALRKS